MAAVSIEAFGKFNIYFYVANSLTIDNQPYRQQCTLGSSSLLVATNEYFVAPQYTLTDIGGHLSDPIKPNIGDWCLHKASFCNINVKYMNR